MAKFLGRMLGRRAGPWATVFLFWDLWKRIPRKHRKKIVAQARKHGPRLVKQALASRRRGRFF